MGKNRLEAFSDGVLAIIITIMVLELKVPHDVSLVALCAMWPVILSYVFSFTFIAIYWNNHHHLLHVVQHVDGRILWANMHLLFWLSLVPFATAWMGENHFESLPVATYGVVLLFSGIAYFILVRALLARHGRDSTLGKAIGDDFKGKISVVFYVIAIPLAFVHVLISGVIYLTVALMWVIPDLRIERVADNSNEA
ncbi:MAG: TMEM175 family protein [Steroidobacter sp.]